jgi:small-conductance mechanosensitive channel
MSVPDARRGAARHWAALLALVLAALVALALPAAAQNGPELTVEELTGWERLADRAEAAILDRNTPDAQLEGYRAEVAAFRNRVLEAQGFYRERISILREQLEALGPAPAEGESEAPEIAERRADLGQRLAQRQAPLVTADEAFRRADAIIRAIDRTLRERQAQALTRLWPTPLNPANWIQGINALISSGLTVYGDFYNSWLDPDRRAAFVRNLPAVIVSLLASALLLLRGRRWIEGLTQRLLSSTRILRGRIVAAFALSLGEIIVPFVGLTLLYFAIVQTGLTSEHSADLMQTLVASGMFLVVARWLSLQVFPMRDEPGLALHLTEHQRRRARGAALILGLCWALDFIYGPFIEPDIQTDAANAVLRFPLIVLAALGLWRMALSLARHAPRPEATGATAEVRFFDRMVLLGAKALKLLALVAPLLGAAGYVPAAAQLVFPAIATLWVIGLVLVLHRLATAIYQTVLGLDEGRSDALVPALVGMALSLAALPWLALIWGVREAELYEVLARIREGFLIGETRIAPGNILAFFVIFAIGFMLTRGIQGALASSVLPKTTMEKGAQKAVVSGLGYLGIFVAALVAFSTAGIDLSGLAIVAGALSVGIGFGLQNIVSNFVSGLILLIERPVSEGDWVEVGTTQGIVQRISVRSTVIETFDKSEVIVPNADLISQRVTNFTRSNRTGRVIVPVAVAYGTDTRRVEAILREIAEAHPIVAIDPKPAVFLMRFGADGIEFEVRAILSDVNFRLRVQSDLNHQIAARFKAEGIEIPFAQRDIWLRNPEALVGRAPVAAAAAAGAAALAAAPALATEPPPAPELTHEAPADNDPFEDERE